MTCENKKLNKRNQKRTRSPPRLSSADTVPPPHSSPAASRKRRKEMHRRGSGSTHKRPSPLSPCVCRYRYLWVDWHLLLLLYKTSSNSNRPYDRARALGDVRVTDVSSYISSNPYPRLRQSRGSETPIVDVNLF